MSLIAKLITRFLSTNFAIKLIYGVNCRKNTLPFQAGFATLQMKRAFDKYVKDNDKILDLGIGPLAVLSIWLKKNKNVDVTGSDLFEKHINVAREVIKDNKVDIKLIKSDLFDNITGKFDIIAFNPPFNNPRDKKTYSLMDRFLKQAPNSKIFLVVNPNYVDIKRIITMIKKSNYEIHSVVESFFNKAKVFIIKRKIKG